MNPELDAFLNDAFSDIQSASTAIGRVVIVPDFETTASPDDKKKLAEELTQLLHQQSPDPAALSNPDGFPVAIPGNYTLLKKYIRTITLHQDPPAEGPWVEVAPPGNWI